MVIIMSTMTERKNGCFILREREGEKRRRLLLLLLLSCNELEKSERDMYIRWNGIEWFELSDEWMTKQGLVSVGDEKVGSCLLIAIVLYYWDDGVIEHLLLKRLPLRLFLRINYFTCLCLFLARSCNQE